MTNHIEMEKVPRFYSTRIACMNGLQWLSPCPCGFFCSECLMMEIDGCGFWKGVFHHILYHTPIGTAYVKVKYR